MTQRKSPPYKPSFVTPSRYVTVSKLKCGKSYSYSDFEELAFGDTDIPVFGWLIKSIAQVGYCPYPLDSWTDKERLAHLQLWQDRCDAIFYNVAHVVSSWVESEGENYFTPAMIDMLVDSARHMLDSTLDTRWLCRSGYDWADERAKHRNMDILMGITGETK